MSQHVGSIRIATPLVGASNSKLEAACIRYARQSERPLMFRGPFALADVKEPTSHLRQVAHLLTTDWSAASQDTWEASTDCWEACRPGLVAAAAALESQSI